jgi:uncharacterized protein (DUF58 family)
VLTYRVASAAEAAPYDLAVLKAAATSLITPEDLARLHHLEVAARLVVEGLQSGAHCSPHRGHSVDFADHRPYVAGDDLRHLDWKVLGRSDRLVLKRYEAETDLGCLLAVDGSASMGYRGERAALSKYRYAAALAATVAYLVLGQQDRAGLTLFHEQAATELRPLRQGQLERICRALEAHVPGGGTDVAKGLHRLEAPEVRRGLVVLFTDALCDPAAIEDALARLTRRGHDLALAWVLDPDETDLGVGTVSRFQGLEGDGELVAEPRALRNAYREVVDQHRLALQTACRKRRLAFVECRTDEPPHVPMNRLLLALHAQRR